jgi:RNA polymerase sigma-70 factor (sigma-E family)
MDHVAEIATTGVPAALSSLAELFVRHGPDATRLAYLITGDASVAEDLAQEAFARVVARLHHLRNPQAFEAYLRRAVVNLAKNHFRRRATERELAKRTDAGRAATTGAAETTVAARDQLRRALLSLPERQRVAIVLRFYLDLSEGATAETMRCPTGTVRSLVSRGMRTLRTAVEDDGDD